MAPHVQFCNVPTLLRLSQNFVLQDVNTNRNALKLSEYTCADGENARNQKSHRTLHFTISRFESTKLFTPKLIKYLTFDNFLPAFVMLTLALIFFIKI